jgi:hypothetical protein
VSVVAIVQSTKPILDLMDAEKIRRIVPSIPGSGIVSRPDLLALLLAGDATVDPTKQHRPVSLLKEARAADVDEKGFARMSQSSIDLHAELATAMKKNLVERQVELECVNSSKKQNKFYILYMIDYGNGLYTVIRRSGPNDGAGRGAVGLVVDRQTFKIAEREFERKAKGKQSAVNGYKPRPLAPAGPMAVETEGHIASAAEASDHAEDVAYQDFLDSLLNQWDEEAYIPRLESSADSDPLAATTESPNFLPAIDEEGMLCETPFVEIDPVLWEELGGPLQTLEDALTQLSNLDQTLLEDLLATLDSPGTLNSPGTSALPPLPLALMEVVSPSVSLYPLV